MHNNNINFGNLETVYSLLTDILFIMDTASVPNIVTIRLYTSSLMKDTEPNCVLTVIPTD